MVAPMHDFINQIASLFALRKMRCRSRWNSPHSRGVSRVPRRFGRGGSRYKARKFVVFSGYVAILLFLTILFEDRLGRLSVTLGVVGAGVAVALQDVIASIAGAFSIGFSRLYTVGDRVQLGDSRGDVIDIGLLRTTLMETGNWVNRDSYNGRIVRIPNSAVLKESVSTTRKGSGLSETRFKWYLQSKAIASLPERYFCGRPKKRLAATCLRRRSPGKRSSKIIEAQTLRSNPTSQLS
jgi:hypothetical protein